MKTAENVRCVGKEIVRFPLFCNNPLEKSVEIVYNRLDIKKQGSERRFRMRIHRLYPGSFGANCYLLIARDGTAAVVDPSPDADTVLGARFCRKNASNAFLRASEGRSKSFS